MSYEDRRVAADLARHKAPASTVDDWVTPSEPPAPVAAGPQDTGAATGSRRAAKAIREVVETLVLA
ncbi:MAG: hypothetical protein ABR518_03240, partial [Actinomycetota bacterium]